MEVPFHHYQENHRQNRVRYINVSKSNRFSISPAILSTENSEKKKKREFRANISDYGSTFYGQGEK
jgi:hypothetical protein